MRKLLSAMMLLVMIINTQLVSAKGYQTRYYPTAARHYKGYLKLAPDGKRFGFSYVYNGKHYVQLNNKIYGGFELMEGSTPFVGFSPDSKLFAFSYWKDGKNYLQINDQVYGGYDKIEAPFFSKRGKFYGFKFLNGNKWYLWINGKRYGKYDSVSDPVFSADETNYAFSYSKGPKWYIQSKAKRYGWYRNFWGPVFSLDGQSIGFVYQKKKKDERYYCNLGGKKYGPFDQVLQLAPGFNSTSFEVAYQNQGLFYLNTNGNVVGPLCGLLLPKVLDGKLETNNGVAFINQEGKCVQVGDASFSGLQEVQPIVCSPQRKFWGFGYKKDDRYYVQINQESFGPFSSAVDGPHFSPNEKAYAFSYQKNGQTVIQTNQKSYTQTTGKDFAITQVACSDNGRTIAVKFRKDDKEYIRVNEIVYGGRGTMVPDSLVVCNDGKYFGYAYVHNNQHCIQINERVFKYAGANLGDFVITPENRVCFAQVITGKILIQEYE